ncbi:MAG: hypothetical protein J5614_08995, partial [Paludibacteraceae bacterium]|nr:hypothetical protein [Paludibacteraceae bacterium]
IGIVAVSYGTNSARVEACTKGITRLDKAKPIPGHKVFVEAVAEEDQPMFDYLKDKGWEYIQVPLGANCKHLFQKEMLWTIGARVMFEHEGIDRCVFTDADCAFHDNSWAFIISRDLDRYGFVQPYRGMAYSGQKVPVEIIPSAGYFKATGRTGKMTQPGGAFACTKEFFQNILKNRWPYNPVGSGDVLFWLYLYGHVPGQELLNCATYVEQKKYPDMKVGYSRLLLNHYFHGNMGDRMYSTRHYIAVRCLTGNETQINEHGLLEWTDTLDGKLMKDAMEKLKKGTDSYLQVNRAFTSKDTKTMLKKVAGKYYGYIDTAHPLYIVTIYRPSVTTPDKIKKLRDQLIKTVNVPFKFCVISETQEDFGPCEFIQAEVTAEECPDNWMWMMAFQDFAPEGASVLYLDPTVKLKGSCMMLPCRRHEFCMTRHDGHWDTKIMYFYASSCKAIFSGYRLSSRTNSYTSFDYLFSRPVDYLIAHLVDISQPIRDVMFHVDYNYGDTTNEIFNFIL